MSGTPRGAYSAAVVTGLSSLRCRQGLILAVVLPALALRVLMPAGFMPVRDAQGGLSLMLCPGEGPALQTGSPDPHAHHHHHHPDEAGTDSSARAMGHEHGSAGHTLCPFALSAGPALANAVVFQALPPPRVDYTFTENPGPLIKLLQRAQMARAPPVPHQV